MAQKMYAYVGNWNFHPADKGISVYVFDPEDGSLELIETIKPEVAAGQIWLHPDKPVLYCVDEVGNRVGELGGGGYVLAFAIDPETGKLTQISRIDSLCPEPCYVVTDKTRKHVLVSSHVDPFNVTKVVKNDDGSWGNKVLMDDAGLLLVGLKDDGSLDAIKDVYITHSNQGLAPDSQKLVDPVTGHIQLTRVLSRQHAVMPSPSGNIFAVPDKGMDRVYTFRVDQENEKIELCDVYQDDLGLFPRYASFHPTLPVLYTNNERKCEVHVFSYDDETGKIALLQKEELLTDEYRGKEYSIKARPMGAQDILAHPNGKALYCTVEGGDNLLVTLKVDDKGRVKLAQNIDCEGTMPRGICLSPDGKFLLSGNLTSGDITVFAVGEDGLLTYTGKKYDAVSPSAIRIYVTEA
ncbi:MAG: lactonase family protein [Lachnospiraceae bacterium]|jgi:6-phosphogluconolactonase (cycloisomerase 2 family)|nr:lactonase family protein [Lachnospiraceae bacterium]